MKEIKNQHKQTLFLNFILWYNEVQKGKMKTKFLAVLCGIAVPLSCFASNEGVPSYYAQPTPLNANRSAFGKYQNYGYTNYVGNTGKKQVVATRTYSYDVPRPTYLPANSMNGTMTTNGIAKPVTDRRTSIYAGYSRRFADFEFKTGVNSVLEWDDMLFNELNAGFRHVFDVNGFDLGFYANYAHGEMASGGLSMDYDLEPYDYAYPVEGIFTVSVGDQTGTTDRLRVGLTAHHIWDIAGWKLTPHIGYEIFKHNLKMGNHIYPNPGVYLPLMTNTGDYVFGDIEGNYYAISPDVTVEDDAGLYQICMGPEDIKVVAAVDNGNGISGVIFPLGNTLTTIDYNSSMGSLPWGVVEGDCVVIGGDGMIQVAGTTHIYDTTWSGFYLGLELEKQMTLADRLRLYFQVSMPKYSSEGTWPNRDDWQQNPSFRDEGDNGSFAYSAELEYSYHISDRLAISLKADTNYFHVGKIPGELYVAESLEYVEDENNPGNFIIETIPAYTEYISDSLNEATWRSFGLHIGVSYAF